MKHNPSMISVSSFGYLPLGGGGDYVHPFQLAIWTDPKQPDNKKIYCKYGQLCYSMRPDDLRGGIKNVLPIMYTPDRVKEVAKSFSGQDFFFLDIDFDKDGAVTEAEFKIGSEFKISSEAWENGSFVEEKKEGKETYQSKARIMIGFSTSKPEGPVIHQLVRTHLLLVDMCIDGKPARYPMPWHGGYYPDGG